MAGTCASSRRRVPGERGASRARGGDPRAAPSPRRRERPERVATLRRRDLDLVGWLGEQYGARTDQLEALLGCGPRTVQRVLARLRDSGLVTTRRLLVGEPAWVIPTTPGPARRGSELRAVAAPNRAARSCRGRQRRATSRAGAAPRRANGYPSVSSRATVAPASTCPTPSCSWTAQRVAIEVELTVKSARRITAILDELAGRFDAVLYFCAPAPHRQLSELEARRPLAGAGRPRATAHRHENLVTGAVIVGGAAPVRSPPTAVASRAHRGGSISRGHARRRFAGKLTVSVGFALAMRLAGERGAAGGRRHGAALAGAAVSSPAGVRRHGLGQDRDAAAAGMDAVARTSDAPVFYLDGKGDRETAARFCGLMADAGRQYAGVPERAVRRAGGGSRTRSRAG